jgi:ankyrin repeat protein
MPTRSLPDDPSLTQLKLQAKELQRAHRAGSRAAAARIVAHHPDRKHESPESVLAAPLRLAAAQLVLAREYGFPSWAALKHRVETGARVAAIRPHPRFAEALAALDAGDVDGLRSLLAEDSSLVHARTNLEPPYHYFTAATLLHHVAGNPWRETKLPDNIVDIARLLLEAGADVDATTLGPNSGTTMGLLVTGKQASDRGFTAPLMDLLLEHGATLDVHGPGALAGSLTNHAPAAAEKMIELGAQVDLFAAAALGRMDLLRALFDADGRLRALPRLRGSTLSERDAIGLAALFAYVREQPAALDFLLAHDGNLDMTGVNNGTLLHRAAWAGDLGMVRKLVALGADIGNRDNPFVATPLSWAQHNQQQEVFDWLRAHCAIDLHDAVSFDLREHVEARLHEDPTAVNALRDQWDIPRCAPLHWAAWPQIEDIAGTHDHEIPQREALVTILLDAGADPNLVAGNGCTPLDVARAGGAAGIIALIEERGGVGAADL